MPRYDDGDGPEYVDGDELHPEGPSADEISAGAVGDDDDAAFDCTECGRTLHELAEKCPGCGAWTRPGVARRGDAWWLGVAGLVSAVVLAVVRMMRRAR